MWLAVSIRKEKSSRNEAMIYTVILKDHSAFMSDWFSYENNWSDEVFCVIDNARDKITFDGIEWEFIERDSL
jgi:hypothetical protein